MKKTFVFLFSVIIISACNDNHRTLLDSFEDEVEIVHGSHLVNKENLGRIEGIHANDSLLVTLDFHDGLSYSLFNAESGDFLLRFGRIGHGSNEIPMGCEGCICKGSFVVFDDTQHLIASYHLRADSIPVECDFFKYQIENAQFTKIALTDDHLILGMGTYNDKYQYVLFDKTGNVYDYAFEIYNSDNHKFDTYHKFLSNQGKLVKHPHKDLFAGTINFSSNIDFLSVSHKKIEEIQSIRLKSPNYQVESINGLSRVIPSADVINGFIDLCATDTRVYALYSEELFTDSPYCSDIILVFDWSGNRISKMKMPNKVYYIAATNSHLITVGKDESGYYIINSYLL